jgi:16S rRNA (cytosine967-C5)-methyltransferase
MLDVLYLLRVNNFQMNINPRLRALEILESVITQHINLQECLTADDTPIIYQLTYGTLRFYPSLCTMVNYALKQPLSKSDQDLYLLLILGIYQLQHLDIPDYAVLKETVDVADKLKKSWAKKLVNAILRRFLRERESFEKHCLLTESSHYNHPQWFIDCLKAAWPEQWQAILMANNEKAPLHLRVNAIKTSREAYQAQLKSVSLEAQPLSCSPDGLCLTEAVDVRKLPGFTDGLVSVQDAASQAVVNYLDLKPGQRVLDACAAPGGKTCHMLEREPNLAEVVALDNIPARVQKITENLERLQLKATLLCGDAAKPDTWWDKKPFDRILLDAPCSATGVIRRHPDIKLLRSLQDVKKVTEQQKKILEALWPLLISEGLLVYTTCSILPEENQIQIEQFLQNHPDAKLITSKQMLPGNEYNADGFFYAVIQK